MKNWKKLCVLALVALSCSLLVSSSQAYTLIGLDWNWLGGNPVTVNIYVNPNCADPNAPNELAANQSAMNTWGGAGANFAFNYAGATSTVGHVQNGQNEINWSTEAGGGALAATSLWGSGVNFSECDIVFYEEWAWSTGTPSGSEFDVESVGLHELGHVVGLDHSQYSSAVMYYAIAPGEVQRILDPDDIAGIQYIYTLGPVTPVVLSSFSAALASEGVQLSWTTASELECYGWSVQRSQSEDFRDVSSLIPGYGTTEESHSYDYTDNTAQANQTYNYRLKQVDLGGGVTYSEPISIAVIAASPEQYRLHQNVPNPFNPSTAISFDLPQTSHVRLAVFDAQGRNVATLLNGYKDAGVHSIVWNASKLTSGIYFLRLEAGNFTAAKKMILMK